MNIHLLIPPAPATATATAPPSLSFRSSTSLFPPHRQLPSLNTNKPPIPLTLSSTPYTNNPNSQTRSCFHGFRAYPDASNRIRVSTLSPQCLSNADIDMVKTREGFYAPKQPKVVILWDLDNKPPRGPPYSAALALKTVAERFGLVVDFSAYANRHAFSHLPTWVSDERRQRRHLDVLERKGIVTPSELYICNVCGRKCKTNLDLKKHFRQLHERERLKKVNRMKQLKGKKRQRFKERFIDKNVKYEEAARKLVTPKVGYGLDRELRRAGVFVKTVEDKPQAADWALKKQMLHSISRGIDWLFLVSDDSDFREMLRKAREESLGTVVVGDRDRSLGRYADLWVPWVSVENGEVSEEDLVPRRKDGLFSVSDSDGVMEGVDDELVSPNGYFSSRRTSVFSDFEEDDDDDYDDDEYDEDSDDDDSFDFNE